MHFKILCLMSKSQNTDSTLTVTYSTVEILESVRQIAFRRQSFETWDLRLESWDRKHSTSLRLRPFRRDGRTCLMRWQWWNAFCHCVVALHPHNYSQKMWTVARKECNYPREITCQIPTNLNSNTKPCKIQSNEPYQISASRYMVYNLRSITSTASFTTMEC